MFEKFFGLTCVRPGCGHRNPKGTEFCEGCGISLAFNRPAILDGNEWQPAADELAAFFRFKDMKKGVFTKTLYVPAGMKAWVLQDDPNQPVLLLDEGPHTVETLFQRMNNFFRSAYGAVLVARQGSVPVSFAFDEVLSLERLALKASITLRLRVRVGEDAQRPDLAAFRRHFMQQPGAVTAEQLARPDVLGRSVLDALKSFVGGRSIEEMAAQSDLDLALNTHLQNRLGALLLDLGLELVEHGDFDLHHEKLDAHDRLQGELWLLRRELGLQQGHAAALNDLFDAREREVLRTRRLEIERKQSAGELDQEDADLAHAMRLRQVEQYEKILQADTREQAARMGAQAELEQLESQYAAGRRERQRTEATQAEQAQAAQDEFASLKALTRIRMDSELEIERHRQNSQIALERERAALDLAALQRQAVLRSAAQDESEEIRSAAQAQQAHVEAERRGMQLELESRRHEIEKADLVLAAQVRQREAARLQAWEDEQQLASVRKLRAEAERAASDQSIDTSRKWMLLHRERELHKREDELERAQIAYQREEERARRAFEEKLKEEGDRRITAAQQAEARRAELAQLGALPVEALISIAESGVNVQALVEAARLKAFSGMSPEQIRAAQTGQSASTAAPSNDGAFVRAFSEQLGTMVQAVQGNQAVHHEQATGNLLRMHEGTMAALLRSQELLAQVAMGHPVPAAPAPAAAPVPSAMPFAAGPQGGEVGGTRCPGCRAPVQGHQNWCGKCGGALPERPEPVRPAAPVQGGRQCPRCRDVNPGFANYCWTCGHAFGAAAD